MELTTQEIREARETEAGMIGAQFDAYESVIVARGYAVTFRNEDTIVWTKDVEAHKQNVAEMARLAAICGL